MTSDGLTQFQRKCVRAAEDAGWSVRRGGKHLLICPPEGRPIPVPDKTPRNRARQNKLAQLRRMGLDL